MYVLAIVAVAITISSGFVYADHQPNHADNNGLVDRVELVEKVLEVERLTMQPSMNLLGTDYLPFDEGKLMSYLKVGENPITNATCYVSVLYPNMTYFINNQIMLDASNINGFEGLYYYDFIVPNTTGIYPVNSYCYYETTQQFYIPNTYVSNFTYVSGQLSDLANFDFDEAIIYEGGLFENSTPLFQNYYTTYDALLQNGSTHQSPDTNYAITDFTGVLSDLDFNTGIFFQDINESGVEGGELLLSLAFDEVSGTVANDGSVNNNDGTYIGTPNLTINGISNTGISFDRIDDSVTVPPINDYVIDMSTETGMFCVGYNSTAFMDNDDTIVFWRLGGNADGFELSERGGGSLRWRTDSSLDGAKTVETNFDFSSSNDFHTVCAYVTSTEFGVYVNGVLDVVNLQNQDGFIGDNTTTMYFGKHDDNTQYIQAELDEFCYVKGTSLNHTAIAQEYNSSLSCSGTFESSFQHEGVKITFDTVYDGISDYDLVLYTNDTSNNYEVRHYLNNTAVNTSDSKNLVIDGLTPSYSLDVTDYIINMQGLGNSSFRITDDVTVSFISEAYLERTVTNFTSIGTCVDKNCVVDFNITLPLGWDNGFLNDMRIFFNAREEGDASFNFSIYNTNTLSYDIFDSLGAEYEPLQFPINSSYVDVSNNIQLRISTEDFDENEQLYVENLETLLIYNGTVTYDLRGNNELVVSKGLNNFSIKIDDLGNANISVVPDLQLEQILLIIFFFILVFGGWFIPAGMLGLAYSFIYLDGLFTLIGAGICALILFAGWKKSQDN
jgi:hypothetical protein